MILRNFFILKNVNFPLFAKLKQWSHMITKQILVQNQPNSSVPLSLSLSLFILSVRDSWFHHIFSTCHGLSHLYQASHLLHAPFATYLRISHCIVENSNLRLSMMSSSSYCPSSSQINSNSILVALDSNYIELTKLVEKALLFKTHCSSILTNSFSFTNFKIDWHWLKASIGYLCYLDWIGVRFSIHPIGLANPI